MVYLYLYIVPPALLLFSLYKLVQIAKEKIDLPIVLGTLSSIYFIAVSFIASLEACTARNTFSDQFINIYFFLFNTLTWLTPVIFVVLKSLLFLLRNNEKPKLKRQLNRYSILVLLIFSSILFSVIFWDKTGCSGNDFIENGQIISG